ncbi:MAG: FISUMP domain-containing protein [bacterium]
MTRFFTIFSLSFIIGYCSFAQIPTSGLVAWYPFNGNTNDESGNGNNGTNNGATFITDRFGFSNKAISFDGINDFVDIPHSASLSITDEFTLTFWIKKGSSNLIESIPISKRTFDNDHEIQFCVKIDPSYGVSFQYSGLNAPYPYYEGFKPVTGIYNTLNDGNWHFLVFQHKYGTTGNSKIYLDNQFLTTSYTGWYAQFNYPAVISTANLWFGKQNSSSTGWYTGYLDDIRIYYRLLNCSEIQQLYYEGVASNLNNGLVAYYPFNGNTNDMSGNGHTGTNYGSTLTIDRFGNPNSAYNFDGTSSYINTHIINDFTDKITIALWFKTASTNLPSGLLTSRDGYSNFSGLYFWIGGTRVGFNAKYTGGVVTDNGINYMDNNWHFVVATYDGYQITIYMDGAYVCSGPQGGDVDDNAEYYIGFDNTEGNRHFYGDIDDIRIYSRSLTVWEVEELFHENGNSQYTIQFAGLTWDIKDGGPLGPDCNYWSNSSQNVWVDNLGQLHLKIRKQGNTWFCSEIIAQQSYGYGEYRFYVASRVDLLDINTVVGLFSYETDTTEIDIEFHRFTGPSSPIGNYTVQPSATNTFPLVLTGNYSTHKFIWTADSIFFQSYHGHYPTYPGPSYFIANWTYNGSLIPPVGNERLILNLWLKNHQQPTNGQDAEIIIKSVFVPGGPCPGTPTISYGGKTYNTVQIGTQCWFKENLNIGTRINSNVEQTNNGIVEKYCYDNLESNCGVYGGLYQWNEMMQYVITPGVQGICPPGWHIPTDEEWTTLTTYLGGESVAGGKMKETGFNHWQSPNTGATNISGFTALPGGYCNIFGTFSYVTTYANYSSSSEYSAQNAYTRYLSHSNSLVGRNNDYKNNAFEVRCLKDQTVSSTQTIQNITIPSGQTNCYNATQTITVAGNGTTFTIQNGGSATMIAGQNILYLPGTTVQSGGYMWGYIAPSGPFCTTPSMPAVAATEDEIPLSVEQSSFKVYPNPTTGNFTLELFTINLEQWIYVEIYSMRGEKIITDSFTGEKRHVFSLSNQPVGIYFIRVITGEMAETGKIIKQ